MKKRPLRIFVSLFLLLALVFAMSTVAFADVGGFAGDNDFGGGDWDFGGNDYDYSGGGGGDLGPIGTLIVAAVGVLLIIVGFRKGGKSSSTSRAPGATPTPVSSLRPISELKGKDPNFSDAAIVEKISNLYVQMQNAWQAKQFDPMRAHMTDALYNQFARQLDAGFIQKHLTNCVDRIAVLGVDLVGWTSDDTNDSLIARVRTRIVDYVIEDQTGKIVRGSNTRELFMEYEWTLIRRKGVLTPDVAKGPTTINCANCGAPMDINQSAKCEYCGSVMTTSDYDWVISSIKGLSQRSGS